MPRLDWLMLAQSQAVDKESNSLSIFDVLEQVAVPGTVPDPKPGAHVPVGPAFSILSMWTRDQDKSSETFDARLDLIGPKNKHLGQTLLKIDLTTATRSRQIVKMPFLPYVGSGRYTVIARIRKGTTWRKVGETNLEVSKASSKSISA